jgi:GH24 family phage-related lysozyme (muramidase)
VFRKGVDEIKLSEGLVRHLYNDAAGYCTIGYGHLIKLAPCDGTEPARFLDGVTEDEAEALLVGDMAVAQIVVENATEIEPTEGQYSALVSFTFNVGGGNFRNSTLLRRVNAERHDAVPAQFRRWRLAGGRVLQGLVDRREREIALYFDGMEMPQARGAPAEPVDIFAGEIR